MKAILVYDMKAMKVSLLFGDKSPLSRPYGLAIDSRKRLYIADAALDRVMVVSLEGRPLLSIGNPEELKTPEYVALDEGRNRLYVSDAVGKRVVVYDLDGNYVQTFSDPENTLINPQGVAVAPDGNIYVADGLGSQIFIFSPEGQILKKFGERSDFVGGFEFPKALAFDSDGHLWVSDSRKQSVRVFSANLDALLFSMTGPITHKMGLGMPVALSVTSGDEIYIADFMARRFSHWRYMSKQNLERFPVTQGDLQRIKDETRPPAK